MKSAEQKAKNVPAIRFAGFDDEWEKLSFADVGNVCMCKRVFKEETSDKGDIPFYKIGTFGGIPDAYITKELYNEYRTKFSYPEKGDILLSAAGTIGRIVEYDGECAYFQDSNIVWLSHDKSITNKFLKVLYPTLKWGGIEGSTIQRLYNDIFLKTSFFKPTISEQQKIGSFFSNIDSLISLEQKKYDKLTQVKKSMLEKMFPKEGATVPEIRFAGFTGDWVIQNLNNICSIITKQTGFDYSETIKPSLFTDKIDNTYSFIQNKDFEGLNINLDTDFYIPVKIAEKFPKITLDQPSLLISISGRIGNVGLFSLDTKAFIGGAVGICKLNNVEDGKIALFELQSPTGQLYFKSLIKASSHANITVEDIRQIVVTIPKEECEKKKINQYFSHLDSLISFQQRKLEKLKNIKKSLLEKMFV